MGFRDRERGKKGEPGERIKDRGKKRQVRGRWREG